MPLQEFWYENPDLLWIYRTSFIKKKEEEVEYRHECINYQAWLTGAYVLQAIGAWSNKNTHYPDKPYGINNNASNTKRTLEVKIKRQLSNGQELLNKRSI